MGGGSGSGGSSGAVDYPEYIKHTQADWLLGTDPSVTDPSSIDAGKDITSALNVGFDNNPWLGQNSFDPSIYAAAILAAPVTFKTDSDADITEFEGYIDDLSSTDQIEQELAVFDIGMRNVNAVHSTSYVIARDIIASSLLKEKITLRQAVTQFKLEENNKVMSMTMEANRLALIAFKEEVDVQFDIDKDEALWDFQIYQMAGNVLASIAGGTVGEGVGGPSKMQSAIGGALSGAAAGAMVGSAVPGIGTAVGAGVGAVIGGGAAFL